MVGMAESAGRVIWRCSVNKVFWEIAQNSQKNNPLESVFNQISDNFMQIIDPNKSGYLWTCKSANGYFWIS